MARRRQTAAKTVETLTHDEASRKNIPTAEHQPIMAAEDRDPIKVAYERRNQDLDPQLVWRGKDAQDWSDLVVQAPPLFIQEKVHPKVLVDDLIRQTKVDGQAAEGQPDLFADFNGLPSADARTEFYQHDANWSNRMILGDSLQVMASLAEREGLRGKVQCIYLDPPYGIGFDSNFQWSTTDHNVRDGNVAHITREPEQVKAFRDTWRDGIHSYLTYLRDRLTVARDLLAESGSVFVQIGDENVHRVRAVMDEVFGDENFIAIIPFRTKTMPFGTVFVEQMSAFVLWYAHFKEEARSKYRKLFREMNYGLGSAFNICRLPDGQDLRATKAVDELGNLPKGSRLYQSKSLEPSGPMQAGMISYTYQGIEYKHPKNGYGTNSIGMRRLDAAARLIPAGTLLRYALFADDKSHGDRTIPWEDTVGADNKQYVVQTNSEVIKRCILMATDPGDLVLDPTCGSGTTAYVAEQWGRRWITIDTSRVALALARTRIMGARYPYYLLTDSPEGQAKESEISHSAPSQNPTHGNIRHGFVYERVPHITLKSIANNAEIDTIYETWQETLEPLRAELNTALGQTWEEWEIPRDADDAWPATAKALHTSWWELRILRQRQIDDSIAAKADYEYLYDKPYEDRKKVRVAGPFTVESLSPHRFLGVDENDELIDNIAQEKLGYDNEQDFTGMVLEHLKTAGVQQTHKEDRITFASLTPWPGDLVCAEGHYVEGNTDSGAEKRAGIFIGPEFGTVSRPDLVKAVHEAAEANFDALVACAFNYDAHASEFNRLGHVPVLKARINADLHMAGDLKNTGQGNLFVVFGEPDIDVIDTDDEQIQVKINGVDVFHPNTGEIRSNETDGIACWFIDTDYNEESFFVRHAYFLGANDPYKALKTTLKAEVNEEAWATLHSDTSRPFAKPQSGRIAVKVINHLGDEVMKVFRV